MVFTRDTDLFNDLQTRRKIVQRRTLKIATMIVAACLNCASTVHGASAPAPSPAATADVKRIVVLGDSLTEGYGVAKEKAWPALLQQKLKAAAKDFEVVNAGVSGSTSASGPGRMAWLIKSKPAYVIVALGANDGLRGLPVPAMEENLNKTIRIAKDAGVKVIVAGMKMPPNYGTDYSKSYAAAFSLVAEKNKCLLIPFLLDKVGGVADLNQTDGIHPNEKGHQVVADTVFRAIEKHL